MRFESNTGHLIVPILNSTMRSGWFFYLMFADVCFRIRSGSEFSGYNQGYLRRLLRKGLFQSNLFITRIPNSLKILNLSLITLDI